ncbi:MAG: type VI secretion system baseplate subunit TssF, partial [Methylomonas sp.]|nr:type VI secretion system baseplate subunit TssF [Methylomonas sp.]
LTESGLSEGFSIPKGTSLRSQIGKGEQTACEYQTAHPLKLFPLEISKAEYLPTLAAVSACGLSSAKHLANVKAAIRIVLRSTADVPFNKMALDSLSLFLRGTGGIPYRLYEQLLANSKGMACKYSRNGTAHVEYSGEKGRVRGMGFEQDEAMLRNTPRSFDGYRMLQEYFAFPERYLFAELSGLDTLVNACDGNELELFVLLERSDANLIHALDKSNFALFCVPAINLFVKRTDRVHVDPSQSEFHIVVDRTRPMDYEIYSVEQVTGYGNEKLTEQSFLPFYGSRSAYQGQAETAFYTLNRRKRLLSSKQRREGIRSSYIGSELFVSLVDGALVPFSPEITMLGLETLCTNRDLPLIMPVGIGDTDFTLQINAPVKAIHCIVGPTRPLSAAYEGDTVWRLISHLSLNYLSLIDTDAKQGAVALRELLSLYADQRDSAKRKQIEGVVSVNAKNVVRRIDTKGPIVFGRGLEVSVLIDESAFEGGGFFLMGKVLEQLFANYVSINSFVETVVRSTDRGEVARWPARIGRRHIF